MLVGVGAGLVGAAFIRLHIAIARVRMRIVPPANARRRLLEVQITLL